MWWYWIYWKYWNWRYWIYFLSLEHLERELSMERELTRMSLKSSSHSKKFEIINNISFLKQINNP